MKLFISLFMCVALVAGLVLLRDPGSTGALEPGSGDSVTRVGTDAEAEDVLDSVSVGVTDRTQPNARAEREGATVAVPHAPPQLQVYATTAGVGVAGAVVSARGELLGETDAEGHLEVPLVRLLEIEHEDTVHLKVQRGALTGGKSIQPHSRSVEVTLSLDATPAYRGRVVDEQQRPIPGLTVSFEGQSKVTGPDGGFSLDAVRKGTAKVGVSNGNLQVGRFPCSTERRNTIEIPGLFALAVAVRFDGPVPPNCSYALNGHTDEEDRKGALVAMVESHLEDEASGHAVAFESLPSSMWRFSITVLANGYQPATVLIEPTAPGVRQNAIVTLEGAGPLKVELPGLAGRPARVLVRPDVRWGRAPHAEATFSGSGDAEIPGLGQQESVTLQIETELTSAHQFLTVLPAASYATDEGVVRFDALSFVTLDCDIRAASGKPPRPILLAGSFRPTHTLPGVGPYSGGIYLKMTKFEAWVEPGVHHLHFPAGGVTASVKYFAPLSKRTGKYDLSEDWTIQFDEPGAESMATITLLQDGAPLPGRRVMIYGAEPKTSISDGNGQVKVMARGPYRYNIEVEGSEGMMRAFTSSHEVADHLGDQTLELPSPGSLRLLDAEPLRARLRPVGHRRFFYAAQPGGDPTQSIEWDFANDTADLNLTPGDWSAVILSGRWRGRETVLKITSRTAIHSQPEVWDETPRR